MRALLQARLVLQLPTPASSSSLDRVINPSLPQLRSPQRRFQMKAIPSILTVDRRVGVRGTKVGLSYVSARTATLLKR